MTKPSLNIVAEPATQEIVMTCVFDAPRELVFQAYTDPNAIPKWWGPKRMTTAVERMEVRPGGIWRFVQSEPDGGPYAFFGVYHAIVPPERIVQTFEFEGAPGHVSLETATLEDVRGKTKLTASSVFQSVEDRDSMLQAGMEDGARETMERFADLLQEAVKGTPR